MKNLLATTLAALVFMMLTTANAQTAGDAPIRVGIAGLAHGHVDGFFQRSLHRPEIQLVGIAEADQALAARYSSQYDLKQIPMYTSLEDMLEKAHPQAVLVYTNTYDHRKVVEACARHGVHVMMEKPMAVSAEDAHAMADAARKGKIQVMVNYETSWYRSNHAAYDMVHEGAIGDIRKVVVHDGHQGPKEINVQPEFFAWLNDPKLNGAGALYDFGCYGADLMTWLMDGQRPTSITAVTRHIKPEIYHVDDDATIILTYPKAQAILQPSWNWPFDRKDMEVYGQTGYVITVRHDDVRVRLKGDEQDKLVAAKPVPPPSTDSITLLKAVVGGAAPDAPSSLETNLIVAEILDAARRSAATGKTVLMSPDGSTH